MFALSCDVEVLRIYTCMISQTRAERWTRMFVKYSFPAATSIVFVKAIVITVSKLFCTCYLENTLSHIFSKFDLLALGMGLARDLLV